MKTRKTLRKLMQRIEALERRTRPCNHELLGVAPGEHDHVCTDRMNHDDDHACACGIVWTAR